MRDFCKFLCALYLVSCVSLANAAIQPCDISGNQGGAFQANSLPNGTGTSTYYRLWYDDVAKRLIVGKCDNYPDCDYDVDLDQWSSPVSITPSRISMPGFGTTIFKTSGATNFNSLWFVNRHGRAGASVSQNGQNVDIVVRNCGFSWNQPGSPQTLVATPPIAEGGLGIYAINPVPIVNNPYGEYFSMPNDGNRVTFVCPGLNGGNPIIFAPSTNPTNPGCPPVPHSSPIKGMNYIYGSTSGTGGSSWPTYWASILAVYGIAFLGFWALGRSRFGRGLT